MSEEINKSQKSLQPQENLRLSEIPVKIKLLVIVLIALIAGISGGLYGALSLATRPEIQEFFNKQESVTGNLSSGINYKENSPITSVVKQVTPAVVSIVISRDISQDYLNSPFQFFYGYGDPAKPKPQTKPNIQEVGAGSGFLVSSDGLILTNKHVVNDEKSLYSVTTNDGKTYEAKVVSTDPTNDLAIIKIEISNAPFLSFADSSQVELGQQVIAIGNTLGEFQNTVSSGIVSGLSRKITAGDRGGSEQLEGVIQTDAAISEGNSGGPLLNLAGQVIGINTAVSQQGQSVGFAIPSNDAKYALDSYLKVGKITRPFLGVRYQLITKELAQEQNLPFDYGALLVGGPNLNDSATVAGSPADKAGLKIGDIILEINGVAVTEDNSLANIIKKYRPGDNISLKIHRGAEGDKTVLIQLGEAK